MTTSNTIVRNIGLLQGITNCLQDWTDSLDQGTNGTNTVKDLLASLSRGLTSLKDDVAKLNQVENQNPLPQMNSIIQSTVPVIGSTPHMINSTHFGQTRESRFPQKSSNVIKRVSGAVIAPLTSVSTRKTPTKEVVEKGGSTTSNEEDDEIPVDEVKLKTTTKNEKVTKRSSEEPGPSGGRSLRKKHRVSYVDYVPFSDDSSCSASPPPNATPAKSARLRGDNSDTMRICMLCNNIVIGEGDKCEKCVTAGR